MNSENVGAKSNHVQLIISAKSSGAGAVGSKVAELPREETRERFTRALDSGSVEVFEMMVGTSLGPAERPAAARRRLHLHDWAGGRPVRCFELPL